MGQKTNSLLVIMMVLTVASIGLSTNVAFAGTSAIGASPAQGPPGTTTDHIVLSGVCAGPTVNNEACLQIQQGVIYDPDMGGWLKELNMLDPVAQDTAGSGLFPFGYIIHIQEDLTITPLGANPSGEWTDWHEVSQDQNWVFIVDDQLPIPTFGLPAGHTATINSMVEVIGVPDAHSQHFRDIWVDIDPAITSLDPSPQLIINKYLECIIPSGCQVIIQSPFPKIILEEFPTSELDYGDDPDPFLGAGKYPTKLKNDGARHDLNPTCLFKGPSNCRLGFGIDSEADGQPNVAATGDDMDILFPPANDDEDGVTFSGPLTTGVASSADVTTPTTPGKLLNAWIDLNQDGIFADATAEQFVTDAVLTGSDSFPFTPTNTGDNYLRFRYATATTIPTGFAADGEVEDYVQAIREGGNGPIGGELIPVDKTALMLAGAQMSLSWMIPVGIAGIGIGFVILRKFRN